MAYSSYLEEHVQSELTKAIVDCTIINPNDPVEYIGHYLLKIVQDDAKNKKKKEIDACWAKEDEELELKRKEKESVRQKMEEEAKMNKLKDEEFYAQLAKCENKTNAMKLWTQYIENKTKSASVYIGSPCELKKDDEDVNGLLYNAVSSKHDQFLMNTTFIESESKGIVFLLLKESEEKEKENENEKENETQAPKQRKHIHIKNVLLPNPYKDKLHFFKYPKVGSFLSFESSIKSYLNDDAIQAQLRPDWPHPIQEICVEEKTNDEDANEEDEEDDKEDQQEQELLPPEPPQTIVKYVISMDSLGGSQLYDTNTIQFVDDNIEKFEDILMKIDVNQYLKQREFEKNLKNRLDEYDEKTKAEIDTKLAEIEKENESNAEQIKLFKKNQYVIEATQSIWSLICDHTMKPQQSSFCRIIAAFIKLFDNAYEDEDEEENKLSLINNKSSQFAVISSAIWDECITCVKEITSEKVNGYNPSEIESFDVALFEKLLNGIVSQEIGNEGLAIIITMFYEFVDSACKLYTFTQEEKKKVEENPKEETEQTEEADAE